MIKETLYTLEGIYREEFRITGFRFGQGDKTACVVGSLRGNEYQQTYICSQLVRELKKLEEHGQILSNKSILVIPCLNEYAMNIDKRFWPLDDYEVGRCQKSFDKQYLRDWLSNNGYRNNPPAELPKDVLETTRNKYIEAYEKITGKKF